MGTEPVLQDLSFGPLVQAIEDNAVAGVRAWAVWPELEVHETADLVWTISDVPFPFFNCVLGPRLTAASAPDAVRASMDRAAARGVPLSWWLGPSPTPSDLGELLEAEGFERIAEMTGMAARLEELAEPPAGLVHLEIEEITDPREFARWCFVMAPAFEFPPVALAAWRRCYDAVGYGPGAPWRHFLARLDGVGVATSSLFLGGGVAGLANVATAAEVRRRGIGRAVSAHALIQGRAAGYRVGTLFASDMGIPVYRRLGFRPVCRAPVYYWKP